MNVLEYIVEPEILLLTWLPSDESAPSRTRRIVGEIIKDGNEQVKFRYLMDTPDYQRAIDAGFKGFPAFPFKEKESETTQNVMDSLMRRLPPRNREDFGDYLRSHSLPVPYNHSDFSLLGYTGAKLPSDGFSLVPIFPEGAVPCDFLAEVVGLRHEFRGDLSTIQKGDPVELQPDRENPVDQDAMAVLHNGRRIGYINRAFRETVHKWISTHNVTATIDRLNGKPNRPLVYIRIHVV